MIKHGLLRDDVPNLVYAMNGSMLGFFILDRFDPANAESANEQKADSSTHIVKESFEPKAQPSSRALRMASQEISVIFADPLPSFRKRIYTYDLARGDET